MKKRKYAPGAGDDTTGKILEEEYFGKNDTAGVKRAAALALYRELSGGKDPAETDFYLPFSKAITYVKSFQPWGDPTSPETKVARDLFDFTCESLDLNPESQAAEGLKFFTAIGSPLDERHGVDAFIEFDGQRVLIDVTKNPAKKFEDSTADRLIIEELPDWTDPQKRNAYLEAIKKYSEYIAKALRPPFEHTREADQARIGLR